MVGGAAPAVARSEGSRTVEPLSQPPLTAFGSSGPRRWLPLRPVVCQHRRESQRLILAVAGRVRTGSAVVLGAGRCQEIPLAELAGRFESVTLNDVARPPLDVALAGLPSEQAGRVRLRVDDLTGSTAAFLEGVAAYLGRTEDPAEAVEGLAQLADAARPAMPPWGAAHDLVIASCVLCQLHNVACNGAMTRFDARFPGHGPLLRQSRRWVQAVYDLARRMEEAFITGLLGLLAPGGRLYLSETIHGCFVHLSAAGGWMTEGSYRMTRTTRLADYLDARFRVEEQGQWAWVADPPGEGQVGRVYSVQGLMLSAG